jgi:hypothetical protein
MAQDFDYADVAKEVLNEHGQSDSFRRRFIGYCENTIAGNSDDNDLKRLIESIELEDGPDR